VSRTYKRTNPRIIRTQRYESLVSPRRTVIEAGGTLNTERTRLEVTITGRITRAYVNVNGNASSGSGKVALEIPLYGRSSRNTDRLGAHMTGTGEGTLGGLYNTLELPRRAPGDIQTLWQVIHRVAEMKAQDFIGRGSATSTMFWELSNDKYGTWLLVSTAAMMRPRVASSEYFSCPLRLLDTERTYPCRISSRQIPLIIGGIMIPDHQDADNLFQGLYC